MGLSTTYKLNTERQTWEDPNVNQDTDYNIGTFLVSRSNNQSGQYPMTTFKITVAYRDTDSSIVDAELYVMLMDLGTSVEFLPQGNSVSNFFPISSGTDWTKYGHLITNDIPNVNDFFNYNYFNYSSIKSLYIYKKNPIIPMLAKYPCSGCSNCIWSFIKYLFILPYINNVTSIACYWIHLIYTFVHYNKIINI